MQHFFPHDASKVTDRIFKFLPNEVRGPVLTSWGLRGAKSALKDTDEKVQSVVWDALLAGDIDQEAFEQAILSRRRRPLGRRSATGGRSGAAASSRSSRSRRRSMPAYELGLFDAKWFFDTIEGPGGKLKGTDVMSEGLTKAELTEWVRKIHASGDGSPKGMLAAIGWERIVGKTPNDVLIKVLDAFAQKVQLATPAKSDTDAPAPSDERPSTRITPVPPAPVEVAEATAASAVTNSTRPKSPFSSPMSLAPNISSPTLTSPTFSSPPSVSTLSSAPGVSVPQVSPMPNPISSLPNEGEIDRLFSESKMPPPEDQEQIVVEEDIEINSPSEEGTTNRPPASEEPLLLKPRQPTNPGAGGAPALRRR